MSIVTFNTDIKPMFEQYPGYISCMRQQTVATSAGAYECDLTDYEIVKALHEKILWVIDDAWTDKKKTSYQAMPAGNHQQLPEEEIKLFKQWIADGLLED